MLVFWRKLRQFQRQNTLCECCASNSSIIQFPDGSNTHCTYFRISIHKRVRCEAKLYRLNFITEPWDLSVQQFQRIGNQARFQPFFIILDLAKAFFHQESIAGKFAAMGTALSMIHCIVTILNTGLVEHGFACNGLQIGSVLIIIYSSKYDLQFSRQVAVQLHFRWRLQSRTKTSVSSYCS